MKGGSTVPLKFNIFAGATEQKDVSAVSSFTLMSGTCSNTATEDAVDFVTTGGTSLRDHGAGGQFVQNWQTPKAANQCYAVTMTTADGSKLTVYFKTK